MTEASTRLALPLLQAGQAQKEVYHNEALTRLDMIVAATVQSIGSDDPPTAPDPGQCWIVGPAPSGAWAGQAGALAGWTPGGWRFVAAPEGTQVWSIADGVWARRSGSGWSIGELPVSSLQVSGVQVVGGRLGGIAGPVGGTTVDAEARTALAAILGALRTHGLIAP